MKLDIKIYTKTNPSLSSDNIVFIETGEKKITNNFLTADQKKNLNNYLKIKRIKEEFKIYNLDHHKRVILLNIDNNYSNYEIENLGAKFFTFVKSNKLYDFVLNTNQKFFEINKNFIDYFLHGFKLKSYEFNLYKSKHKDISIKISLVLKNINLFRNNQKRFEAIELGTNYARDLVSEPPNILYPKEYVIRLLKLKKLGIKVTVYNEAKLKILGMNSLLGVGRGSSKESFLVTLEWYGNKKNIKSPLSFVGKGVCFDTGGISLKPAKFMEEMKYDMAGSAVVAGLIKSLAIRKAKVNAVGIVGLVENMPGGNAQRPGDIVKAYNGKTIEVLNTDAEGRLVLADALSFTEKKFKPKFIIDLATLTGAIIVSLGEEYAGLFSNNDDLSKKLFESGEKVNEKVWRLPLHKNYDKLIESSIADIQNINYSGGAGSITAAQFLQRFIEKTPWAHLDIAGMAFSKKAANLNPGGATGFGVRLLNQLIEDYYE